VKIWGIDALLLRQFSQSLTETAFQWYYSLENDSISTWDEMADALGSHCLDYELT
jgi:hypothetical protein